MRTLISAAALLLPIAASANTPAVAAAPSSKGLGEAPSSKGLGVAQGSYTAEYTGYSHGLTVLKLSASLTLSPTAYGAHVSFHTAGMAGFMVRITNDSHVSGVFHGDQALPALFEGSGYFHGGNRATRIVYKDGNPTVQLLTPPVEHERSPVPPDLTPHTIDTLSAVALLIHEVAQGGDCAGSITTFDGRRLATQTVHDAGSEDLAQTGRSMFHGPALRCDFEGRQLAGFVTDENQGDLRRPRHGTAWLAAVLPNVPPVPVRVSFDNNILGQVTLYLTGVSAAAAGAAAP